MFLRASRRFRATAPSADLVRAGVGGVRGSRPQRAVRSRLARHTRSARRPASVAPQLLCAIGVLIVSLAIACGGRLAPDMDGDRANPDAATTTASGSPPAGDATHEASTPDATADSPQGPANPADGALEGDALAGTDAFSNTPPDAGTNDSGARGTSDAAVEAASQDAAGDAGLLDAPDDEGRVPDASCDWHMTAGPTLPFGPPGQSPSSEAIGDFNGDGKLDLVVGANPGFFEVFLGNGDGTFNAALDSDAGGEPVAVGDFTGNGDLDIAVTNSSGGGAEGTVDILLGNGAGTFGAPIASPAVLDPSAVAVGDFNGDGKLDLVFTNYLADTVSVLLGQGDGSFDFLGTFATFINPLSVAVGDFNADGIPDLAVANFGSETSGPAPTVSVLLGDGDGTFAPQVQETVGQGVASVAVGDLNGDGKADIAAASNAVSTASVLLGNGDGTFQACTQWPTGEGPWSIAIADFNGDGAPDLATANQFDDSVTILLGTGNGNFEPQVTFPAGQEPWFVAAGDFNNDGYADLAVANFFSNDISIFLGAPGACQ